VVDRWAAIENIPHEELARRTEAMRLLECGAVGKRWAVGCNNQLFVNVINSPVADVENLIVTKQRHNRVHSEARGLGIIGEDEIVNISSLASMIRQRKEHLRDKKVIAERMQRRQEKLLEADAITVETKEGLGSEVENLLFPSTYGQDDPTKDKQEPLSKAEAAILIQDNFTYVSVPSELRSGIVSQVCQLLFGQGSGTSGNGKHCSREMIKKRATKAREKYEEMISSERKTDGNDDGECVVFFWSFVHAPSVIQLTVFFFFALSCCCQSVGLSCWQR
jgi:hypothetical protein